MAGNGKRAVPELSSKRPRGRVGGTAHRLHWRGVDRSSETARATRGGSAHGSRKMGDRRRAFGDSLLGPPHGGREGSRPLRPLERNDHGSGRGLRPRLRRRHRRSVEHRHRRRRPRHAPQVARLPRRRQAPAADVQGQAGREARRGAAARHRRSDDPRHDPGAGARGRVRWADQGPVGQRAGRLRRQELDRPQVVRARLEPGARGRWGPGRQPASTSKSRWRPSSRERQRRPERAARRPA